MTESTNKSTNSVEYEVSVQMVQGVSKKGNNYEALEVKVGDYRQLLFPTPIERAYINHVLEQYNKAD